VTGSDRADRSNTGLFIQTMQEVAMTQSDLSTFSASGEADDGAASDAGDAAAVVAGNGGGRISEVVDVDDAKFPESTGTVELMVTQVDYTIEGSGREEHPAAARNIQSSTSLVAARTAPTNTSGCSASSPTSTCRLRPSKRPPRRSTMSSSTAARPTPTASPSRVFAASS